MQLTLSSLEEVCTEPAAPLNDCMQQNRIVCIFAVDQPSCIHSLVISCWLKYTQVLRPRVDADVGSDAKLIWNPVFLKHAAMVLRNDGVQMGDGTNRMRGDEVRRGKEGQQTKSTIISGLLGALACTFATVPELQYVQCLWEAIARGIATVVWQENACL